MHGGVCQTPSTQDIFPKSTPHHLILLSQTDEQNQCCKDVDGKDSVKILDISMMMRMTFS